MTQAVCFNCGELKFGSFTECGHCHLRPATDDHMAFSMAISDHYFSIDQLNEIGQKIKNGENIKLNEDDKRKLINGMQEARENNELVKTLEQIQRAQSQSVSNNGFFKNLFALVVLIAMGVSFVSAILALFSGEILKAILLIIGAFVGVILVLYLPKLLKRTLIIKKHFKKIGNEILEGMRDQELLEHSKSGKYTSHGLAAPFGNEAASNALGEIKAKGLANSEEKDGIWLMGNYSVQVRVDAEKILAEKIAIRSKAIGANIID